MHPQESNKLCLKSFQSNLRILKFIGFSTEDSPALVIILTTFLGLVWITAVPFHSYPFSLDEYAYWYQATIFSKWKMYLPVSDAARPLIESYMVLSDGRLFAKYPPLYPLFLAIGVILHAPFVVNPFFSMVTLVFLYKLAKKLFNSRVATLATLACATNSYFLGYGASFFSHSLVLSAATIALYYTVLYLEIPSPSQTLALKIGLLIAGLCLVRPLDALIVGIGFGSPVIWKALKSKYLSHVFSLAVPGFTGTLLLFVYNYLQSGIWAVSTYPIWKEEFKLVDSNAKNCWDNLISIVSFYFNNLRTISLPLFWEDLLPRLGIHIVILAVAALVIRQLNYRWIYFSLFVFSILLYNFHQSSLLFKSWPQYGPRYWYLATSGLMLLSASALVWISNKISRHLALAIYLVLIIFQVNTAIANFNKYSKRFVLAQKIQQDIETICPEGSLVIQVMPDAWKWVAAMPRFVAPVDFKRNFFLNGSRLNLIGDEPANGILELFPRLKICKYEFQRAIDLNQEMLPGPREPWFSPQ